MGGGFPSGQIVGFSAKPSEKSARWDQVFKVSLSLSESYLVLVTRILSFSVK